MCRNSESQRQAMKSMLEMSDKYLHLAILLGYIAIDHGADLESIDGLIRKTPKEEIDRLLLERLAKGD